MVIVCKATSKVHSKYNLAAKVLQSNPATTGKPLTTLNEGQSFKHNYLHLLLQTSTYCLEGLDSTLHLKTIYPSHYQRGLWASHSLCFFFNTACFLSGRGQFKLQMQQKIVIVLSKICGLSGPKRTSSLHTLRLQVILTFAVKRHWY